MKTSAVTVIRRPVKHARLRVRDDGSVQLIAPESFEQTLIDDLLKCKADWIARQQEFFESRVSRASRAADEIALFGQVFRFRHDQSLGRTVLVDRQKNSVASGRDLSLGGEQLRWYRRYARAVLAKRSGELSAMHRVPFNRLFVRDQETKWGSCSTKGNISLNWRLILAPQYVIDYVILHELLHTRVLNHTQRFWVLLKALCPDCQKAINWLNANPPPRNRGVRSRTGV
jgi:predicted metal-dependent hydrolase